MTPASDRPVEPTLKFSRLLEGDHDSAGEGDSNPKPEPAQAPDPCSAKNTARLSLAHAFVHDFSHEPLSLQFVDSSLHGSMPVSPGKRHECGSDQTVIEDSIDLGQQVEFFLVLGQSDAAAEQLLTRLDSGAASALPCLKLMELYQRLGRESAFEAIAVRLAARFEAFPPPGVPI